MTKIFTRNGDSGYTNLLGKGSYPKDDERIEVLGALDELNSVIGLARSLLDSQEVKGILLKVQKDLYLLMAQIAIVNNKPPSQIPSFDAEHVQWLESEIERISLIVEVPDEFIIPGDSTSGAILDITRTTSRRVERVIVRFLDTEKVSPEVFKYINRLSSLFFILELWAYRSEGFNRPTMVR